MDFSFVSAADGTNVVQVFEQMVAKAMAFKQDGGDFMTEVLNLLTDTSMDDKKQKQQQQEEEDSKQRVDAKKQVVDRVNSRLHSTMKDDHDDMRIE